MNLAARIRDDFERRIRSGELPPGTRIAAEQEIAAAWGCARATANKALAALAREGMIERRRRAGSFVAEPRLRAAAIGVPDIAAMVTARGGRHRWHRRGAGVERPPVEAEAGGAERWRHVEGVHFDGAQPLCFERRWIRPASVPGLVDADFEREAPGGWLLRHVPWSEARHRVRAVAADAPAAAALHLARGAPCLQVERWTWRGDAAVTYVRQTFPGDRFDLVEAFHRR